MLRTLLIRHEILCLVFAVVEAAGQNHIIIGTLRKIEHHVTKRNLSTNI